MKKNVKKLKKYQQIGFPKYGLWNKYEIFYFQIFSLLYDDFYSMINYLWLILNFSRFIDENVKKKNQFPMKNLQKSALHFHHPRSDTNC